MLYAVSIVLQHSSLAPGFQRQLQADVAAAAVGHAAAILQALPTVQPSDDVDRLWSANLCNATDLLGAICHRTAGQPIAAQHPAAGGSSGAAQAVSWQASGEAAAAAGWQVARLLPRLAAGLADVANNPPDDAQSPNNVLFWLHILHQASFNLRLPLLLMLELPLNQCSPQQLSCWLAAATASLRLLPFLALLADRLRQHSAGSDFDANTVALACSHLAGVIVTLLPTRLEECQQLLQRRASRAAAAVPSSVVEAQAWDSLPEQLWALHTGQCRLVAALSAPAGALRMASTQLTPGQWRSIQLSLNRLLNLIVQLHQQRFPLSRQSFGMLENAPRYACLPNDPIAPASSWLQQAQFKLLP